MTQTKLVLWAALAVAAAGCDSQTDDPMGSDRTPAAQADNEGVAQTEPKAEQAMEPEERREERKEAAELVKDSAETLRQMKTDPELKQLLTKASGVFIVPEYGRGAVGVGVRGGSGVLMAHENGKWSAPAFYDIGGISVGPQFGGEGGEIAMVLMDDQALNSFKGDDTFSLNADAKLTIVDYSTMAAAKLDKEANVIFWSDTEGAFVGATLSATDIAWDDEENRAYYGKAATPQDVFSGKVGDQRQGPLQKELSSM